MESISIISVVLLFSYGIYLINRYQKATIFKMKVTKLCNTKINEAILEKDEHKLNLFMKGRSVYSLYQYLLSFKKLKLHNYFSKEFMTYVNKGKIDDTKRDVIITLDRLREREYLELTELAQVYNYCACL